MEVEGAVRKIESGSEFARIRMAKPRLVILDEPMGGVNPVLGERIVAAIEGFIASGTTVIIVEHNLPFIERIAQSSTTPIWFALLQICPNSFSEIGTTVDTRHYIVEIDGLFC